MARDPPSLLDSSELRDLSLTPSAVRNAKVTIVHPQLRDLILPLERGRVLYPRGSSVEEQRWRGRPEADDAEDEDASESGGASGAQKDTRSIRGTTKTFVKLPFTPNCLTATKEIFACGGQHGELYLCNLPPPLRQSPLSRLSSAPPMKAFSVGVNLPTRSINNSIVILPSYPHGWNERSRARRIGGTASAGSSRMSSRRGSFVGGAGRDDEAMEIDEDEDEDTMEAGSPATYPNTVPFLHAPRIPNLPPSPTTRRATSFSHDRPPTRSVPSRSSFSALTTSRPGQPPIQYVTSYHSPLLSSSSLPPSVGRSDAASEASSSASRLKNRPEPRILISNNDQSVKMFSLGYGNNRTASEAAAAANLAGRRDSTEAAPEAAAATAPASRTTRTLEWNLSDLRERQRLLRGMASQYSGGESSMRAQPTGPRSGSGFGWDGIGINEGLGALNEQVSRDLDQVEAMMRDSRDPDAARRREVRLFERSIGLRRSPAPPPSARVGQMSSVAAPAAAVPIPTLDPAPTGAELPGNKEGKEDRKLTRVGGAKFKFEINHSSLSPDLKTMVSVGDSTDVYLFEVIDGGREFRKIGVYQAATDSGFSTAWSKDGRKFAVASQDGQVTVWDHRSSRPLAIFHTSSNASSATPSFTSDLASHHSQPRSRGTSPVVATGDDGAGWDGYHILIDPVTGDPRNGSSTSGREAARVVKFSPEGSSRDLLVFSEEDTNIQIVDARTFNTHLIIPVPNQPDLPANSLRSNRRDRDGVEGGVAGIAGVAFDPTGDWLYSGTESTVVEWDMRRSGGIGDGVWKML